MRPCTTHEALMRVRRARWRAEDSLDWWGAQWRPQSARIWDRPYVSLQRQRTEALCGGQDLEAAAIMGNCDRLYRSMGNEEHPPCGGDLGPDPSGHLQAKTATHEVLEGKIGALATELTILRDNHRRLDEKVSTTEKLVKEILTKISDTTKNISKMEK
ncbi:hypothetical protein NDU88_004270 [Pleurodeles waltl]|uniref:Uncharacterized protein n=1 Tax=Pleurodeles waltl TaxID=8319 RepID=A0AAV7SIC2_PLEWA|nr:hypothetical protein NDU88_004270 [Pleurodeles waltl]